MLLLLLLLLPIGLLQTLADWPKVCTLAAAAAPDPAAAQHGCAKGPQPSGKGVCSSVLQDWLFWSTGLCVGAVEQPLYKARPESCCCCRLQEKLC